MRLRCRVHKSLAHKSGIFWVYLRRQMSNLRAVPGTLEKDDVLRIEAYVSRTFSLVEEILRQIQYRQIFVVRAPGKKIGYDFRARFAHKIVQNEQLLFVTVVRVVGGVKLN